MITTTLINSQSLFFLFTIILTPIHSELCQWLWPRLLQQELDKWAKFRNAVPIRKQKNKPGPSGVKAMSRNEAFTAFDSWGGVNCLLPVDRDILRQMKEDIGGDQLIAFSTPEFAERAEEVFESLGVSLTMQNVWDVFQAMLPLVFPERVF